MPKAIAKGGSSSTTNQILVLTAYSNGHLKDIDSATWEVFDQSTPALLAAPSSIASGSVNTTADKVTLGRYAPTVAIPSGAKTGEHFIRWSFVREAGGPTETYDEVFQVVATNEPVIPRTYMTLSELKAEGFTDSDTRLVAAIRRASQTVERITGRFFEPRYLTFKVDGRGSKEILLMQPVIAIEQLIVDEFPTQGPGITFGEDEIRVYNRHLQGFNEPDDRNNPRVSIFSAIDIEQEVLATRRLHVAFIVFPRGRQNITLTGLFGYTDFDGTPLGSTPDDIKHAVKLLAARDVLKTTDVDGRADFIAGGRVRKEKTRDQFVEFWTPTGRAQSTMVGYFTGLPEVDTILASYMRPPALGAA